MEQFDTVLYFSAAALQLAAMFYAVLMAREVNDRRPWLALFIALFIMFVMRIVAIYVPVSVRAHFGPWIALPISTLLFLSLLFMRRVALAERESKILADQRTSERDESESRYRSLVELSPDVIFVASGGQIVYVNAAAVKFFGAKTADDLLHRSPLDFTGALTRPIVEARLHQSESPGHSMPLSTEEWVRLDGRTVPVESVSSVVPWRGNRGVQVILRDISERIAAEKERSELLTSERAARSAAEHASRMKDEFLATVSHELRTPLNAILGWSQILRQTPNDEEDLHQGLETIERNARVQTQLIEDLLDMSRIITGKLRLDVQRLPPISFIEAAIDTIRPAAMAKGIRIEQMLDPTAGPVLGDPGRLQQVAWNLLSNAVKFSDRGGKVQVVLKRVNSQVELTVADTGRGIHSDFLPHIFDRFRQADASTTRQHGGLGLGLAIVKQLVDLHGGSVEALSAGEGRGSTFTVLLPLSVVQIQDEDGLRLHPKSSRTSNNRWEPVDLTGLKVVVVDDEGDACGLIKRMLDECRAEVHTANSAEEALRLIEQVHPDVLVSDIGMPDVDGYEFLRRVRTLGPAKGGKVPAIALTAFARSEDRTRALMAGYSVHVSKPVEAQELIVTVASLAGRTGAIVS
jgi:PAS domain S-box-containing protein